MSGRPYSHHVRLVLGGNNGARIYNAFVMNECSVDSFLFGQRANFDIAPHFIDLVFHVGEDVGCREILCQGQHLLWYRLALLDCPDGQRDVEGVELFLRWVRYSVRPDSSET